MSQKFSKIMITLDIQCIFLASNIVLSFELRKKKKKAENYVIPNQSCSLICQPSEDFRVILK